MARCAFATCAVTAADCAFALAISLTRLAPSPTRRALNFRRWNHSESPCTGLPPAGEGYCFESSYAIRDIKAGEELLDDYGLYSYPPWYNALCAEFGCPRDFVVVKPTPVATPKATAQ